MYFVIKTKQILCLIFIIDVIMTLGRKNPVGTHSTFKSFNRDYIWDDALNVMTYHRSKMNEYLCKNYIANEIVDVLRNRSADTVEKSNKKKPRTSRLARESMLADQGSQKYQDWLSRSSTLEDIYHQFEHSDDPLEHKEIVHDEDENDADVTGYALLDSKHLYSKIPEYELHEGHFYEPHLEPHYTFHEEEKEDDKGLKLKELFHFALTSIAFLAFACFMIEVIMCLMEVPPNSDPDYLLVPTTTGVTAPGSKLENEVPETRAGKSLIMDPIPVDVLNKISGKMLSSMDSLITANENDGECLQKVLCQNSKYSKTLPGMQKIWLPVWSFGISWIGGRLSNHSSAGMDALKYLKSTIMGLGLTDCQTAHPKCVLKSKKRKSESRNNHLNFDNL